jgi:hypothetical protein
MQSSGGAGYGQHRNSGLMEHKSTVPTTGILNRPAITRCCCFNGDGECLAGGLRPGDVHSADYWDEVLLPEVERQQELGKEVVFRADAAFAKPEIIEGLKNGE